ncbi:MAG: glycosyltransferase [Gemmataceae bacterium]|nr:glycosyltransferase [Gemmataceae bacterium]
MQLAALVESVNHVCTRYRLRAFEPLLREAGHALEYEELPRGWLSRWSVGRVFRNADAVILQRKLLSAMELSLLRRRSKYLVFDLDDAVWMRDSFSGKGFECRKRESRFTSTVRAADCVVGGNDFLAEYAMLAGAKDSWVVPTCVNVHHYPLARHEREKPMLVWVGSSSTLKGLEAISPYLEAIGQHVPGTQLKLVCDRFLQFKRLPVIKSQWNESKEASEIAAADIGISWIPDDPWSSGKCGLKLLQYMAAGLPVVTNPAGVHPDMVTHGENGFLVHTESEWVEAIRVLARDPDLRRRMGAAGRKIVEERYSLEAGAMVWNRLIEHKLIGKSLR